MKRLPGILRALDKEIQTKRESLKGKKFEELSNSELFTLSEIGVMVEEKEFWEVN